MYNGCRRRSVLAPRVGAPDGSQTFSESYRTMGVLSEGRDGVKCRLCGRRRFLWARWTLYVTKDLVTPNTRRVLWESWRG